MKKILRATNFLEILFVPDSRESIEQVAVSSNAAGLSSLQ